MKKLALKIATPERLVYSQEVDSVSLPTSDGEITVLPGHVPLITSVVSGEIIARTADHVAPMAVVGGFAQISQEGITILADFAEHAHELSEDVIVQAQTRAAELLAQKSTSSAEDFEHFEAELERSLARSRVGSKWRNTDKEFKIYQGNH